MPKIIIFWSILRKIEKVTSDLPLKSLLKNALSAFFLLANYSKSHEEYCSCANLQLNHVVDSQLKAYRFV